MELKWEEFEEGPNPNTFMAPAKTLAIILTLICIICSVGWGQQNQFEYAQPRIEASLTGPDKPHILGEPVVFDVRIVNRGDSDIRNNGWDVASGYVLIYVSTDGATYKHYDSADLRAKRTEGRTLKPSEETISRAGVLSNLLTEFDHLSEYAARAISDKKLMTPYAFPTAGEYFVKCLLVVAGSTTRIETEPVKILVVEPIGQDREVWEKIKDQPTFGYFIQTGEVVDFKSKQKEEKFLQEVEQLINNFPQSILAGHLRKSLTDFQANRANTRQAVNN